MCTKLVFNINFTYYEEIHNKVWYLGHNILNMIEMNSIYKSIC